MQTINMIAYKRKSLQRSTTRKLRKDGNVPCVVYGTTEVHHITVPAILFRPLLRSQEAHFVDINLEGTRINCILQDTQHHPVGGHIVHADFLILGKKVITMKIPLNMVGNAPGLLQGGSTQIKLREVSVKALPKNMPAKIEVDISQLEIGKLIRVKELPQGNYLIREHPILPVVSMEVPRAARSASAQEEKDAEDAKSAEAETTDETSNN